MGINSYQQAGVWVVAAWLGLAGCNSAVPGLVTEAESASGCLSPADADGAAQEVVGLVNARRSDWGLSPVAWDETAARLAWSYACTMIEDDFFAHVHPDTGASFADRIQQSALRCFQAGENLAAGQLSPAEVMQQWMDSPGHMENILDPDFTGLGVGVRQRSSDGRFYWVQIFVGPTGESMDGDCSSGSESFQPAPGSFSSLISGGLELMPPLPQGLPESDDASVEPATRPGSVDPTSDE